MHCHVCLYFISGKDLEDEDTFCDKLEDVVTSIKRNGVAIKGKVHLKLLFVFIEQDMHYQKSTETAAGRKIKLWKDMTQHVSFREIFWNC